MHRINVVAIGMWVFACAAIGAAEVWESKPFATWTDVELKEILASSPWSGKASVSYIKARGADSPPIDETVHVTWASALPMRQARVRQDIGVGGTVPKELEPLLAPSLLTYVITLKVSGGPTSSSYARTAAAIQKETFLMREGKAPLAPDQAEGSVLDKDGKVVESPPGRGAPGGPGGGGAPRGGQPANGPAFSVLSHAGRRAGRRRWGIRRRRSRRSSRGLVEAGVCVPYLRRDHTR